MNTTTHIREALDILLDQIVQSADEDERRELSRAVKALNEAMLAIGDARHRTDPRKEFVPYPVPYREPWTYPRVTWVGGPDFVPVTWETGAGGVATSPNQRVIATNSVEA